MIHYRKFELNRDLTRLEQYLRDFVYRISASIPSDPEKIFTLQPVSGLKTVSGTGTKLSKTL